MPEHAAPHPVCSQCNYDLSGLIEPGDSCVCPECSKVTTHQLAMTRRKRPPTFRIALVWVLIFPCAWAVFTFLLFSYGAKRGGDVFLIPSLLILLHIPITTPALCVIEWKSRKEHGSYMCRTSYLSFVSILAILATISFVILGFAIGTYPLVY